MFYNESDFLDVKFHWV